MKKFGCIILAAGSGNRFGSKKQFYELNNKPLWEIVKNKCKAVCDEIFVVGVDIEGGSTRQESVFNGLKNIKSERVVILEAARPLVFEDQILQIGSSTEPSCTFYNNPVDTTYSIDFGFLKRDKCLNLQVPQAFITEMILEAHNKTKMQNATDDTILMFECFGIQPSFYLGGENLIKITYPSDIILLENLWKKFQY